jgi:hypothetical protein
MKAWIIVSGLAGAVAACTTNGAVPARDLAQGKGASRTAYLLWSDGTVVDLRPGRPEAALHMDRTPSAADPSVALPAGLEWRFDYRDVAERTRVGFDDPQAGAARRQALEETFKYVTWLLRSNRNVTLSVRVERSINQSGGLLARGGTYYPGGGNGFYKGHAATHIQTGRDPDTTKADVAMTFNFYSKWHLGKENPPADAYDFRSVAIHEILHALGILSKLGADGKSTISNSNPGRFTTWDRYFTRANGTALMSSAARFVGTAGDLRGVQGEVRWAGRYAHEVAGRPIALHTPNPFTESSLGHFSYSEPTSVMHPGILKGQRLRVPTKVEEAVLRDLGFVNARIPGTDLFDFKAPEDFPAAGILQTAVLTEFDDKPGVDLVILEQPSSGASMLRIYSGLARNTSFTFSLPGDTYLRMSAAEVGPDRVPGAVLSSFTQESLLAVGGLRLPAGRTTLDKADFEHIHEVRGPQSGTTVARVIDPTVAKGNFDQYGGEDFLTVSPRYGLLSFLHDGIGYQDRLGNARTVAQLAANVFPALDLTAYETGGPLALEVPFGLGGTGAHIVSVPETGGTQTYRSRHPSADAYRIEVLARYGVVGFTGLKRHAPTPVDEDLARIRILANGKYEIEVRWTEVPSVADIKMVREPDFAIVATGKGHTLEKVGLTGDTIERLGGSTIGYRDGELGQALFNNPTALCVQGRTVYVVDHGNNVIRRVDLTARTVTTVAGRKGVRATIDGPRGSAAFDLSRGELVRDACAVIGDSLYILDGWDTSQQPQMIRKVNLNNGYVSLLPEFSVGPTELMRELTSHGLKLFFIQGPLDQRTIQSVELFSQKRITGLGSVLRVGDVNGDGLDDVVSLLPEGFRAMNFYPGAAGGFGPMVQHVFDIQPANIHLADVNGDARLDVVGTFDYAVRAFLGDGAGKFTEDPQQRVSLTGRVVWSDFRDMNRDGRVDAVLLTMQGHLLVMLGNADRRWGTGAGESGEDNLNVLPMGLNPLWFHLTDADADGLVDILTRSLSDNKVSLHRGKLPQ